MFFAWVSEGVGLLRVLAAAAVSPRTIENNWRRWLVVLYCLGACSRVASEGAGSAGASGARSREGRRRLSDATIKKQPAPRRRLVTTLVCFSRVISKGVGAARPRGRGFASDIQEKTGAGGWRCFTAWAPVRGAVGEGGDRMRAERGRRRLGGAKIKK